MNTTDPSENIDVSEDFIGNLSAAILKILLQDHTKSTAKEYAAIFWATDNYKRKGPGFGYFDPIAPECVTGKNGKVIQPRVVKDRNVQSKRSRDMAEVFTPAWVCNAQNNLVDNAWFGREGVFNRETVADDGSHAWEVSPAKIEFPEGKTWKDYVQDPRLEITCGEAPYIASRYDATTGEMIPVERRVGFLDRKLRVVGENAANEPEWLEWAENAYKSTYGYEWQGDNLLLAREALLMTLVDYHKAKFGTCHCDREALGASALGLSLRAEGSVAQLLSLRGSQDPQQSVLGNERNDEATQNISYKLSTETLMHFSEIISWNLWQMDGLKGVIPCSCKAKEESTIDLFGGEAITKVVCPGCEKNDIKKHNGIYCKIKDWQTGKAVKFVSSMK